MKNTTLIYIEKGEKYLMLHRTKKENDINKDKWIGVGGKAEENESPYACAVRETLEETGLRIENPEYRGIVTFAPDKGEGEYMHLFVAKKFFGKIKECNEGVLEWIDKKELLKMNIWEGDRIFLDLLDRNIPFFDLRLEYKGEKLVSAELNGKEISK